MNVILALLLDSVADHWPDGVVVALLAVLGWLITRLVAGVDDRQKAADGKIEKNCDDIGKHEIRITKMETVAEDRERAAARERS